MSTLRTVPCSLTVLAALMGGCNESSGRKVTAASSSASAPPARSTAQKPEPPPKAKPPPCRAIGVDGEVRTAKRPVVQRQPLDGKEWIELSAKSELQVKHTASGREYSLEGPALALPCREGREQIELARGEIATSVGVGARPGALVVIATPFGVVRYGEASLRIVVEARRATVRVETGAAWLAAARGSRLVGKERLIGPKAEARLQFSGAKLQPGALVSACEEQAETAKRQAQDLIEHSREPNLGERAKAHMEQRSAAREACLVAEAAVGLAQEPAGVDGLQKRVSAANRSWRELPAHQTR